RLRLDVRLPRVSRVGVARDELRDDARQRLHLSDRDDVPARAGGRAGGGSADHLHRPRARHLEDVGSHRRRGHGPRHLVGYPRSNPAPARRPVVTTVRSRVRGFHVGLAFISIAGLLYRIWYDVWERGRLTLN